MSGTSGSRSILSCDAWGLAQVAGYIPQKGMEPKRKGGGFPNRGGWGSASGDLKSWLRFQRTLSRRNLRVGRSGPVPIFRIDKPSGRGKQGKNVDRLCGSRGKGGAAESQLYSGG